MFLHPDFIKFEKPKNELYLTLSALVDSKDKEIVLRIQKEEIKDIIKKEELLKDLEIQFDSNNLHKRIKNEGRFIYEYPPDRLHSSIVNFATYDINSLNDFNKAKEKIEKTNNFVELKSEIKELKKYFLENILKNEFIKVEIRRIYLPAGIEKSLALNVFPLDNSFFLKLREKVENIIKKLDSKKLPISHDVKIKAFPEKNYQYFALNIFRFIDTNKDVTLGQGGSLYEKIKEINSKLSEKSLVIKMKPEIVISDPYLSNYPYLVDD